MSRLILDEACYVNRHVKMIALVFSAMRHFAQGLRDDGWAVEYTRLDDPGASGSICGELLRYAERHGTTEVIATEPGEFRLIEALENCPLSIMQPEGTRLVAAHKAFEDRAKDRKSQRLEYFCREMRRKTGLLMNGDDPEGDKWNHDHDNRKTAPDDVTCSGLMQFTPDEITEEVLDLVESRFGHGFGQLRPFWFAATPGEAKRHLNRWVKEALPKFGDCQNAMLSDQKFLYHPITSAYIHVVLLDPLEVCQAGEKACGDGDAPINAVEGFIRQIIGWREFMRGICFHEGPDHTSRHELNHKRKLPAFFWDAETDMACLRAGVEQTRQES